MFHMKPDGIRQKTARKLHVRFYGRVQGVGFRYIVQDICTRHGVTGWVRNLDDGSVEAELFGELPQVEEALAAIKVVRAKYLREVRQDLADIIEAAPETFEIRH